MAMAGIIKEHTWVGWTPVFQKGAEQFVSQAVEASAQSADNHTFR
jgi:hypothetical protein